jgi:opacity protein-like surface antigen
MTRTLTTIGLAVALTLVSVLPARADATAFIGSNTNPEHRPMRGLAVGMGFLVVAFEFEYATTSQDANSQSPERRTGSGNLLVQTPVHIFGLQPYFTTGGGMFRERVGTQSATGITMNTGGGVKISLAGPLQIRLDYRVFRLGKKAVESPAHRVYAGLNLKF